MKKISKKIFIPIILIILIILGSTLYHAFLRPEALRSLVEYELQKKIKKAVTIREFSIDIMNRPVVTLGGIELGSKDDLYMKAESAIARFSPWYLLLGRVEIKDIALENPEFIVNLEKIKPQAQTPSLPLIRTAHGTLRLKFKGREIVVDKIRGSISGSRINLEGDTLGGSTDISAWKLSHTWKGSLKAHAIVLERITAKVKGQAACTMNFRTDMNRYACSLSIQGRDIIFPWGADIAQAALDISAEGDRETLKCTAIDLKSSLIDLTGSARIQGLKEIKTAMLDLELKSGEFVYEDVVQCLPTDEFPPWLKDLLTKQIRDGRSRFPIIRYQGTFAEMTAWNTCLKNLFVEETINGQSFSAFGGTRVTGVTGLAVARAGTIEVRDLTGMIGKSRIKAVNLKFPDIASRGFRLSLGVDLDMAASDFVDAWRASVLPEEIQKVINPVNQVTGGSIRGTVLVYYEEITNTAVVKGGVTLTDCSFSWDKELIQHLTGMATAEDYAAPVIMQLAGVWNGRPVDSLSVSLHDPFKQQLITFALKTKGLPAFETFHLDILDKDTTIQLSGSGKWPILEGELEFASEELSLFGNRLRSKKGPLTGKGIFSARLAPVTSITIPDLVVSLNPDLIHTQINLNGDQANFIIAGIINLANLQPSGKADYAPLDGSLVGVLHVAVEKAAKVAGSLNLDRARLVYKEKPVSFNGLIIIDNDRITSASLTIKQEKMTVDMNGSLTLGETPFLSGDVSVDSLKIGGSGEGKLDLPKKFRAKGRLSLTRVDLYGIPVDKGEASAELEQGVLRLVNMDFSGPSGTLKGSCMLNPGGGSSYDLNLGIKDAPVADFIRAFATASPWMEGQMDLQGHLWGNADAVNGDVSFAARKGRIQRYNLVSRIFSVLNPYKIIKTGEFDLLHGGFPFNFLSSTFTIRDSVVSFEDFYLDSNSLQVSAIGKYTIPTQYIDAIMGIEPLETFDKTISRIPIVGWVLTGDKGTLIVVSVRVKGPIDDTSAQHLPSNTISKPVAESLLRVLNLPVDILTKPVDVILPGGKKENGGKAP